MVSKQVGATSPGIGSLSMYLSNQLVGPCRFIFLHIARKAYFLYIVKGGCFLVLPSICNYGLPILSPLSRLDTAIRNFTVTLP